MGADQFVLAREARQLGTERQLYRRMHRGELVRLRAGVFLPTSVWTSLDSDAQYRARVAAAAASDPQMQVSHDSAAALWRLPILGAWPSKVHETVDVATGGRSTPTVRRHTTGLDPSCVRIDGINATSLARTAIDIAAGQDFARAVVIVDAALSGRHLPLTTGLDTQELRRELESYPSRAPARVRRVLDVADDRAQSPGESFSRVQMLALGAPTPELQVQFADRQGRIGPVDFYRPELDIVGEFDGKSKYGKQRLYQKGLTLEEILLREKRREDRIRRLVSGFIRWDWPLVRNPREFALLLLDHGVPLRMRPFETE